ncbi:MAG: hypothetical protein KAG96_01920 [Ichthyobacteriaceae bacterium]|nr:hypothetical protein [Ichthyobacteriaceae bacterium]
MKKYFILGFTILGLLGSVSAQENNINSGNRSSNSDSMAGKFTVSLLIGQGNFFDGGLDIPVAAGNDAYWSVDGSSPEANMVSGGFNSAGISFRYFFSNSFALKLDGGALYRNTPARNNVPGIINPNNNNVTWIPNYDAVVNDNEFKTYFNLGTEFNLSTNIVRTYLGLSVPFYYSRHSQYNPSTIKEDDKIIVTDISTRHVEIVAFGAQFSAGADYNISDRAYIGIEIKPVSYLYAISTKKPAAGLELQEADTHTVGFFTQPLLKIGFIF